MKIVFIAAISILVLNACQSTNQSTESTDSAKTTPEPKVIRITNTNQQGMVKIPGGIFEMGSSLKEASANEKPVHKVKVSGFWMDATELTNAQFAAFVKASGYVTTAEKKPEWEELKKQLPAGTPKPADEELVPAGLVFFQPKSVQGLQDYTQWWKWVPGANWRHPEGPESTILGKDNEPVVQISNTDAMAYCKWAGKRLPTEAEWEMAARAGLLKNTYPWGNQHPDANNMHLANIWQGDFPIKDDGSDGFKGIAPVKQFKPNAYGLYDMAGNVWEWTADWYHEDYYNECALKGLVDNPTGATTAFDPEEPYAPKKVIRGGSFLCNDSYCTGFRVSRRMQSTYDTGTNHIGFRCVNDL